MTLTEEEAKRLSQMLFSAREIVSMYFDVVKIETGQSDKWLASTIDAIDTFRASQGWSKYGWGDEKAIAAPLNTTDITKGA